MIQLITRLNIEKWMGSITKYQQDIFSIECYITFKTLKLTRQHYNDWQFKSVFITLLKHVGEEIRKRLEHFWQGRRKNNFAGVAQHCWERCSYIMILKSFELYRCFFFFHLTAIWKNLRTKLTGSQFNLKKNLLFYTPNKKIKYFVCRMQHLIPNVVVSLFKE